MAEMREKSLSVDTHTRAQFNDMNEVRVRDMPPNISREEKKGRSFRLLRGCARSMQREPAQQQRNTGKRERGGQANDKEDI